MIVDKETYWQDRAEKKTRQENDVEIAKVERAWVVGLDAGRPILRFVGETTISRAKFPALRSYSPVDGEMVVLLNGVIIGGVDRNA